MAVYAVTGCKIIGKRSSRQKLRGDSRCASGCLLQCKLRSVLIKGALTVRGQFRMSTMFSSNYHVVCSEEARSETETERVSEWMWRDAKKEKRNLISVSGAVCGSAGDGGRRVGVHNNSFTDGWGPSERTHTPRTIKQMLFDAHTLKISNKRTLHFGNCLSAKIYVDVDTYFYIWVYKWSLMTQKKSFCKQQK